MYGRSGGSTHTPRSSTAQAEIWHHHAPETVLLIASKLSVPAYLAYLRLYEDRLLHNSESLFIYY